MQYGNHYYLLAQVYGGGSYDSSTYANTAASGSSSGGSSSSAAGGVSGGKGVLTDTGFDLLLVATLAFTLIFIATIVRFWKRPKKKLSADS
jgi:hypothetical protein